MTAKIIDGAALARQIRSDVAQRAATLTAAGVRPGLAVILVGEDPASSVYVRNKVKDCEEAGFHSILDRLPADTSEPALRCDDASVRERSVVEVSGIEPLTSCMPCKRSPS